MNGPARPAGTPFEAEAASYDDTFTETLLGRRYRSAVWARFPACFPPASRVLEVNCGTGVDAVELAVRGVDVVATDGAAAMVAATRATVVRAGMAERVAVGQLDLGDPQPWAAVDGSAPFDGILSNFGGLNCFSDSAGLAGAVARLAAQIRPGGVFLAVVMGRVVPWELAWFAVRGEPRRAVRRLRRAPSWRGMALHYPTPASLRRVCSPWFSCRRQAALGALLPPPYAEAWAGRHPRLIDNLDRAERRVETAWPLPWLCDHFVVELVRR